MPHAFILGGTGQIGLAIASRLLGAGWTVTSIHRGLRPPPGDLEDLGAGTITLDRRQPGAPARALSVGGDLLIDVVAYDAEHARQLLDVQQAFGALVVVSSSSVYRDARHRTLDEAAETGFPELPIPVSEENPTVAPGNGTYSTRKVALERALLDGARVPLTILRPAAISGPGSTHPREWWLVKRILDGRPVIPLAYAGESRFHTTSVANIAALVHHVALRPGRRVLNVADPAALSVSEIAAKVAERLRYRGQIMPVPVVDHYPPVLGRTPWSVQHPFVIDTSAAEALGYRPATTYVEAIPSICDWLSDVTTGRAWRTLFPVLASYPFDLFDYAQEDAALVDLKDKQW